MTRTLLLGALALALGGWGWWQHGRAVAALERAEALVAGYAEAARMRAAQDVVLAAQRAEAAALDHDLTDMEGSDAPLSDYLDAAAGRLWP